MSAKDFATEQEIRWCPGCGNYIVLATVQKVLSAMGIAKENIAFVSGIGCSSRFVYYLDTYGFHTIHGRATAVAAGLKIARPELSVWIVTGDGDGLSIGLGHLLHLMRRNIDVNILLFNNQIYGLTKGQYSPTSRQNIISNSSPFGSIDKPFNPIKLAMAAECSFIARTLNMDHKHLGDIIQQAAIHKGTSFVEILQNCIAYNENDLLAYKKSDARQEHCIYLEPDKPIRFGKQLEKGLTCTNQQVAVVDNITATAIDTLLVHKTEGDNNTAAILSQLQTPEYPLILGVFQAIKEQTYHELMASKTRKVKEKFNRTLQDVLYAS